jgi:hypothetical protein
MRMPSATLGLELTDTGAGNQLLYPFHHAKTLMVEAGLTVAA